MKLIFAVALGMAAVFTVAAEEVALSSGISTIVKLSKSGAPTSTVQEFIKKSQFPFKTTADDVVYMQKEGVPHEVITLLIDRSVELHNAAYAFQAAEMPSRVTAQSAEQVSTAPFYYTPVQTPIVYGPPMVIRYVDRYPAYPAAPPYFGLGFYPAFYGGVGFRGGFHIGSGHGFGHR